ncbi:hypothetical protein R1flu_025776 [Riccia fluitans]|uniref:Uncharacterized protein n=1 Tax=Riccia fluitans TaxID=41844 RepID=A0ABD1XZ53_9MARC
MRAPFQKMQRVRLATISRIRCAGSEYWHIVECDPSGGTIDVGTHENTNIRAELYFSSSVVNMLVFYKDPKEVKRPSTGMSAAAMSRTEITAKVLM